MVTSEFTIRPSAKLLKATYLLAALLAVAVLIAWRGEDHLRDDVSILAIGVA